MVYSLWKMLFRWFSFDYGNFYYYLFFIFSNYCNTIYSEQWALNIRILLCFFFSLRLSNRTALRFYTSQTIHFWPNVLHNFHSCRLFSALIKETKILLVWIRSSLYCSIWFSLSKLGVNCIIASKFKEALMYILKLTSASQTGTLYIDVLIKSGAVILMSSFVPTLTLVLFGT